MTEDSAAAILQSSLLHSELLGRQGALLLAGEGQAYISVLRMLCHEEGVTCSWDLSGWCPITIFHLALDRASLTSSSSICAFQDCSRMPPAAVMLCTAYLPMPSSGLEKVSALGTEQTQPALS